MGWIDFYNGMNITPYKTDFNMLKVVKIRQQRTCFACKKTLNSGTRCYGKDYVKLCLSCGYEFHKKAIKEMKEITKRFQKDLKLVEKNKQKWEEENALNNL